MRDAEQCAYPGLTARRMNRPQRREQGSPEPQRPGPSGIIQLAWLFCCFQKESARWHGVSRPTPIAVLARADHDRPLARKLVLRSGALSHWRDIAGHHPAPAAEIPPEKSIPLTSLVAHTLFGGLPNRRSEVAGSRIRIMALMPTRQNGPAARSFAAMRRLHHVRIKILPHTSLWHEDAPNCKRPRILNNGP